ncbi:MAG TPA: hydrogenase maturation nickel metallochaperone HypA [Coleofasciculaceae cyanobacterium]
MHEVGMMKDLLDTAVERAKQEGANHINEVHLRVGAASGVVPTSLELAFEVAKKGTIAEAARLETEVVPVICYCAHCNLEFQPADSLNECPECHQTGCKVQQGQEFELAFLEVS